MIRKTVLKNNITFLEHERPESNAVSMGFWFSAGSRYEKDGQHGISHFVEHMLFKGTKNFSQREISCLFDRLGGYINAFTERENVCVYFTVPWDKDFYAVKKALSVVMEMCTSCTFPLEEFIRERKVVENEILSVDDDVEESSLDEFSRTVWPNQNLSNSITGTVSNVREIKREDLVSWYEKYFVNGELLVVAAGNTDSRIITDFLETLPMHKKTVLYPLEKHFNDDVKFVSSSRVVKSAFNQVQIYKSFEVSMPVTEKRCFEISIFNAMAGDTMSSRIFDVIREKNGLCYSTGSFFTYYEDSALWTAFASCEKKNCIKVLDLLDKEIKGFLTDPFSGDELSSAVSHLCGEEILNDNDTEYLMKRLQRSFSLGLPLRETNEVLECIRKINKNDIMQLCSEILSPQKSSTLVYGPGSSIKLKRRILCQ